MAVQTPKQRLANERFNKNIEKYRKYGKKKEVKKDKHSKPDIPSYWFWILVFVLIGGGVLELISLFL